MPDTISGFPIIASAVTKARGVEVGGHIVVVDRGSEYEERFVVAWVPWGGKSWIESAYCEALSEAIEVFGQRLRREIERGVR
jgi:hypothetical protein